MDGIPENANLIPDFTLSRLQRSGPSGREVLPEALQPLEEMDRPPTPDMLAAAERRTLLEENASLSKEEDGVIRTRSSEEKRRFPDFDEKIETEETLLEQGGSSKLISVRVTREQIALEPEEAAAAQANLDPERLRALLFD